MASIVSSIMAENGKVVLLGASGRLGGMLRRFWPGDGAPVCQSRRKRSGFVTFDLIDDAARAVDCLRDAQAVFCLSGVTPAHAAARGDAMSLNADLAVAAVRASAEAGAGRVFVASSAAVYGAAGGVHEEAGPCVPVSDYGRAKLAMEQAARAEAARLGQSLCVLRIGNVAGADAILGGWHPDMQIDRLADGRTPRRSYIGPETLAMVLHALSIADTLPGTLNIAAPGTIEMGALLDAAALPWMPRPAGPQVIGEVALCTRTLEAHVRFAPDMSTATGMVAEWRRMNGTL